MIRTEKLYQDPIVNLLYAEIRENAQWLFHTLTSARISKMLGWFHYDLPFSLSPKTIPFLIKDLSLEPSECLDNPYRQKTLRALFERKIRYWDIRPMSEARNAVVSPADAKMLAGSLNEFSRINIKNKFFDYEELIGSDKTKWLETFSDGDIAIFRLTPDKYHYNHTPVAGKIIDLYEIRGDYHSCNPSAVVHLVTPYSKNKRTVTIFDTNVEGGTQIGRIAMVEIVALMIGDIVQCYSETQYDTPQPLVKGMFLAKGQPKSLFRPGSSTIVLFFEKNRIQFSDDIIRNMHRPDVISRFSKGFGKPLVETDVNVRSEIGQSIHE
jgi:phosphatidylserine decarboxylase